MRRLVILISFFFLFAGFARTVSAQAPADHTVSGKAFLADGSPATSNEDRAAAVFALTDAQMNQFEKCLKDGVDRMNCAGRNKTASSPTGDDGSFSFRLKDGVYHLLAVVDEPAAFSQSSGTADVTVQGADVHKDVGINQ